VTYEADDDAGDAAAAISDIAAQDYVHADAQEVADPAAAAAAEAADLRVIQAELHHHAAAMVKDFNALYELLS
jgi:hypothetical protein